MKRILLMIVAMTFGNLGLSQIDRTNIWYFGHNAGLDFTSGTPIVLTDGALWSNEGCASISDTDENLLFYTTGKLDFQTPGGVWNKNHQIMPNGKLYGGCHSAVQSSTIIPKPNDLSKYYIFTLDCAENWLRNGLMYSIVDMTLDGGLGDVTTKDVQLSAYMNEGLTAIPHSNVNDIWIVGHKAHTDTFYAYQVTSSGILPPLKQQVGPLLDGYCGHLKASPLGDKIFFGSCGTSPSGIYDFDSSSGVISNLHSLNDGYSHGTFSPNGERLYVTDGLDLYQYNLAADNINASKLQIAVGIDPNDEMPTIPNSEMQIAPDGKIYIASPGTTYLNVINCPNNIGMACNYQAFAVDLNGQECGFGLPNHMNSYFLNVTEPCSTTITTLSEPSSKNYQIAPNPFSHSTTLTFENSTNKKYTMILYDIEGRVVQKITGITTDHIIIEKANLPIGLYFFQLYTDNQQYTSGKLLIK